MALDKPTLKAALKQAFIDELGGSVSSDQNAALERISTKWSDAIDTYVKTGTVAVPSGIPVTVGSGLSTLTGATTAGGTGTIS